MLLQGFCRISNILLIGNLHKGGIIKENLKLLGISLYLKYISIIYFDIFLTIFAVILEIKDMKLLIPFGLNI